MTNPELPLERPEGLPVLTPEQILLGPPVSPQDRVSLYSPEEFERFIQEWAFFCLQEMSGQYVRVARLGGAGDRGRDVIGYIEDLPRAGGFDVFQCKHYDQKLAPGDLWPELGKLCYLTFTKEILLPRRYYIIAPRDLGPTLHQLLDDPPKLRDELVSVWDTKCGPLLKTGLSEALKTHIDNFDFSIVRHKPILELISEFHKTPWYAPRFGGGLQLPPPVETPPPESIATHEHRYVEQLIDAYRDKLKDPQLLLGNLSKHFELHQHFNRSRERFYCAEALQRFARDALAGGPGFSDIQDQVYEAVIDICASTHDTAYERVIEVTSRSTQVAIANHPLRSYLKAKNLMGICHQLANVDRLQWLP